MGELRDGSVANTHHEDVNTHHEDVNQLLDGLCSAVGKVGARIVMVLNR